jgi:hippurate hydrolase
MDGGATMDGSLGSALAFVQDRHEAFTRLRRDLHAHPELGFEEHRTAALVAERLHGWGIEVHTGVGRTGVVGVVHGRGEGPRAVGLRADMDALPLTEDNDFAHRSTRTGLMHGCGHDGHTTMLLAAAEYLVVQRDFDGRVVLIFQPAEEGRGGAKAMIEDGLFARFPVDEVYALHNWPGLPAGQIGLNPGPMMAAADRVEITITGRGGHGAHPHLAVDPVLIAAHIVIAAQSIVARNVPPLESAVVSLCAMQAGDLGAMSVVPAQARLVGTVRTFQRHVQDLIEERLAALVRDTARAFGGSADVRYTRSYPATINLRPQYEHALAVARALVGDERVVAELPPSMGSEDFSFMLHERPGCYVRLGQGGADGGCWLHNSRYDFNDAVIPLGAAYLAALAQRRLPRHPAP